jgi:thiamine kinase-like enzyme
VPYRIGEVPCPSVTRGVPIPDAYEPVHERLRRIEVAFRNPVEMRPCHNDLLNANFIDDGERIRIVDWEYAGMGDPFFDLGNFSVNHGLGPDEDATLLEAYDAGPPRRERLARLLLMRIVSDFREAMWGVLRRRSAHRRGFVAYAAHHFGRLLRTPPVPSSISAWSRAVAARAK